MSQVSIRKFPEEKRHSLATESYFRRRKIGTIGKYNKGCWGPRLSQFFQIKSGNPNIAPMAHFVD
jgi:hypothetical protein